MIIIFQPLIPQTIVDEYKEGVRIMLENNRIGPELKMQDFDNYVHLINGEVFVFYLKKIVFCTNIFSV